MLAAAATISAPVCFSFHIPAKTCNSTPCASFPAKLPHPLVFSSKNRSSMFSHKLPQPHFRIKASASVGSTEYTDEPTTNVRFQTSLSLPGCSSPLSLLGTGYREKVFAMIGVKVYAAGLYVDQSIFSELNAWKGRAAVEIQNDSSLFDSIFRAPLEKSLQIVLVRDVDGKTFWDALDDAISPRITAPTPVDKTALSSFRSIFLARRLKKGTSVFLTWLGPSKMLVCISSDGLPSMVDATILSGNVTFALYDVFFGGSPVSPSLKASVTTGLATILK